MSATKDKLIDRMNEAAEDFGSDAYDTEAFKAGADFVIKNDRFLLQKAYDYVVKINPPNVELINKLSKYLEDEV